MRNAPSVVICVPTFRRPENLHRLLDAIARLKSAAALSVLVADNDAEAHAGFDLVQTMTDNFPWQLTAVIARERGLAQVRNTLIAHALPARPDFIAMIDDDEWPGPEWIDRFLAAADDTGADVLQGSILFGRGNAADGHADIRRPSGPVAMLQGAGNLLIRASVLETMDAPWFDPAFALSGGEDRDFFVRLAAGGTRFAWADDAIAYGDVPETRAHLGWLLTRAYSVGNSDMRVLLKHRKGLPLLARELAKIAAALLLSPFAAVILAPSANRRALALQRFCRAAGKLAAIFGVQYNEYSVVHGA